MIDLDIRERISKNFRTSTIVEAGAGTGKTTLLIDRIFNMVTCEDESQRISLSKIVAITFTKKAAAELKDRLRGRFLKETSSLSRTALLEVDDAQIGTIHSFALKLLQKHGSKLGLPPVLELLDDFSLNRRFDEWWSQTILASQEKEVAALMSATDAMGISMNSLKDLVKLLALDPKDTNGFQMDANGKDSLAHFQSAFGLLEETLKAVPQSDSLDQVRNIIEYGRVNFINSEQSSAKVLEIVTATSWPKTSNIGTIANAESHGISKQLHNEIRGKVDELLRCKAIFLRDCFEKALENLLPVFRNFRIQLHNQGLINYDDQLALTNNLLLNDATILHELSKSIQAIFVDEFQDTDPIQFSIVKTIWDFIQCPLFLVGDPKQAIYGFRGSDVRIMQDVQEQSLLKERIQTNFRSSGPIIQWVNSRFELLFNEPEQVTYSKLISHSDSNASQVDRCIRVMDLAKQSDKEKVEELRLRQAKCLADNVQYLHHEEGIPFKEIAVLYPKRTGIESLLDAFEERGIPYQIESRVSIFESEGVHELLSVLKSIDDPFDQPALVGALRSSLFAHSDQELYDYRIAGGEWTLKHSANLSAQGNAITDSLAILDSWRANRINLSISDLIKTILKDRYAFEVARSVIGESQRELDYRAFTQFAYDFESDNSPTLRSFLNYCEMLMDQNIRQEVPVNPDVQNDAVRLLTIHSAKGLEFSVVILMGLETSGNSREVWLEAVQGKYEYYLNANAKSAGSDLISLRRKESARLESNRLLYVAATRAKDKLVVALPDVHLGKSIRDKCYESLEHLLPELWNVPRISIRAKKEAEERVESKRLRVRSCDLECILPSVAATTLAHDEESSALDATLTQSKSFAGGGAQFGIAVHSVLQAIPIVKLIPFTEDYRDSIVHICEIEGARQSLRADQTKEVIECTIRALQSKALLGIGSNQFYKEIPFSVSVEGKVLQCVIDLLIVNSDGSLSIIDYKTDSVSNSEDIEERMSRYRVQAGCYALAANITYGAQIRDCTFLFLRSKSEISYQIKGEQLNELVTEAKLKLADFSFT